MLQILSLNYLLPIILLFFIKNSNGSFFGRNSIKQIPNEFWGPSDLKNELEDSKIYPFEIKVDENILQDLQLKLEIESNSTERFLPPLEGISGFEYGINSKFLKKIIDYWKSPHYNWREREKVLNKYPHFKTRIAGLDIHFQHAKSSQDNLNGSRYRETRPVLVLHGWPGSFVEFQQLIPLLLDPQSAQIDSDYNFEVINPSLPGYGFSDAPHRPGLGPADMVPIFLNLMNRLGHQKFYIQAGDFGSIVATHMATVYPQKVIGLHSNMCTSTHPLAFIRLFVASIFPSYFMTPAETSKYLPLSNYLSFILRETGHFHIQATKPDTIGLVLSLTPSGLAAYILEKFSAWTNLDWIKKEDGGILDAFSMDDLLDNLMIYWVTNTVTTSVRLYLELLGSRETGYGFNNIPVRTPVGCLVGGKDPYAVQSRWVLQDKFPNMITYKLTDVGGHFIALEQPAIVAEDFFHFLNQLETKMNK